MQKKLPVTVDFLKQVERNACYEGNWLVREFERLAELICSDVGEVQARLKFGTRAGTHCLDGSVTTELELSCQRCLEPVRQVINSTFRFGLVRSEEEAASLPDEFEPLLVSDSEQSLLELVEDEILLSLPLVARHENECSEILQKQVNNEPTQDTYKPFAALKDLMS